MPLETATFLNQLVSTNPAHTDGVNQGDAHLRLIKGTLLATFPNFTAAAVVSTNAQIDAAVAATVTGTTAFKAPADGVVATPEYTFASETGLGFYRSASHTLSVASFGAQIFSWSNTTVTVSSGINLNVGTISNYQAGGSSIFPLTGANIATGTVTGANIANNTVTWADIQVSSGTGVLIGGTTAGSNYSEQTIGAGLKLSGGVLTNTLPQVPGVSADLKITNNGTTPNTKVDVSCSWVIMTDGSGNFDSTALNIVGANLGTTGINALETGATIAAATDYFVWAVSNGTTRGVVLSTSSTSPNLTGGLAAFTMKYRIGCVKTAGGSAQLMGTLQRGRTVQYLLGTAQTTVTPKIAGVSSVASITGITVTGSGSFVPTTATKIRLLLNCSAGGSGQWSAVGPNANFNATSGTPSLTIPPFMLNGEQGTDTANHPDNMYGDMMLESTQVFYINNSANTTALFCIGWEDPV